MPYFFELADDVCIEVLSNWIETTSLAILDSAFCNTVDRIALLKLMIATGFSSVTEKDDASTVSVLRWISIRRLKMRKLILNESNVVWIADHKLNWSKLAELQVRPRFDCCLLSSNIENLDPSELHGLQTIKWTTGSLCCISDKAMLYLSNCCHSLLDIRLDVRSSSVLTVVSLIRNNPHVRKLDLTYIITSETFSEDSGATAILEAAVQCCNNLCELELFKFSFRDGILGAIAALFRRFPNISNIGFVEFGEQRFRYVKRTQGSVVNSLVLTNTDISNFDAAAWQCLFSSVPRLHYILAADSCGVLSEKSMLQFISVHHPELQSINIDVCHTGFEFLKQTFPQCIRISVGGMSVYKYGSSTGGSGTAESGSRREGATMPASGESPKRIAWKKNTTVTRRKTKKNMRAVTTMRETNKNMAMTRNKNKASPVRRNCFVTS